MQLWGGLQAGHSGSNDDNWFHELIKMNKVHKLTKV
jgi:hypothetical protein